MKVLTGFSLVLVASAAAVSACGNDFEGCKETRTCPLPEGAAGEGVGGVPGESGGSPGEQAGSPGLPTGGGGGETVTSASGAGGMSDVAGTGGAAGADAGEPCEQDATECVGNLLRVCGDDGVWEEPETCPDDAPICRNGTCKMAPSCAATQPKCGSTNDSCCSSPIVEGGAFDRRNDVNRPAQVADFRLDQFEVTVGRFRNFVIAVGAGYRPATGAGKHEHLNGEKGLVGGDGLTFESGWLDDWNELLPTTTSEWSAALSCSPGYQTWSLSANNDLPINCVDWIAAYAFCTWDGGFLPSNTELNYAAAAGKEQRLYAWGDAVPGEDAALAAYGCYFGGGAGECSGLANIPTVGSIPAGAGKWGQLDLAGSVFEWSLDWTGSSPAECNNCAVLDTTTTHVRSGGSFASAAYWLPTPGPNGFTKTPGKYELGVRCARMP